MLKAWKKIETKEKFANQKWKYHIDTYELPGGKQGEYHYLAWNGGALVIPKLDNGKFLLIKQYRYLFDKMSLEFPAGSLEDDNTIEEAARRELIEETGMTGRLEFVGKFAPALGNLKGEVSVFEASDLETSNQFEKDELEEFEYHEFTSEEIDAAILNGEIWSGISIAAWMLVKLKKSAQL